MEKDTGTLPIRETAYVLTWLVSRRQNRESRWCLRREDQGIEVALVDEDGFWVSTRGERFVHSFVIKVYMVTNGQLSAVLFPTWHIDVANRDGGHLIRCEVLFSSSILWFILAIRQEKIFISIFK